MSPPAYFCAEAEVEARSSIENKIFIVFINLCVSYVLQGAAPVAVRNQFGCVDISDLSLVNQRVASCGEASMRSWQR